MRPSKLDAVNAALSEIELPGITVTDVRGFGRQRGHTATRVRTGDRGNAAV